MPVHMKDINGIVLTDPAQSAKVWHASRQLISTSHATRTAHTIGLLRILHSRVTHLRHLSKQPLVHPLSPAQTALDTLLTQEELAAVFKHLPNNKAPGADGIPYNILKATKHSLNTPLLSVLNYFWETELTRTQWDTAVIQMIYKKGDPFVPKNYRAIVLISTLKKIYEGLICNRLLSYIHSTQCLHKNQFSLLPNRNISEAIFNLTQTIHTNHHVHGKPSYVAFIDFKTAFPSTCRPALWAHLFDAGIQKKLWRNLQSLYTNTQGRVLHTGIPDTDTYNIKIGLLEGSKLSPILYAFLANSLLMELQQKFPHLVLQSNHSNPALTTWTASRHIHVKSSFMQSTTK